MMEKKCMIEVDGQLDSDSETILKTSETGTVIYKHASCQAASDITSEAIVPIMFCALFSPVCEASVQVNLPIRSHLIPPTPVSPWNVPSNESKHKAQYHTLNVSSGKMKGCLKTKTIEDIDIFPGRKGRNETDLVHSDEQEVDDDDDVSSLSPEEDYIEKYPEDSEFSSDNDLAFWEKMKRHEKQKSSSSKHPIKYPAHSRNIKNKRLRCSLGKSRVTNEGCDDQLATLLREGGTTFSAIKGPGADDDWVTDDEVDDDDQENIDLAFKREWKEKRLPYNSKEKNFVCEICGKRYSKHSYLRAHIVREHKENEGAQRYPYSCQYCKKVYIREKQLLQHQQQNTGPCEICGAVLECSSLFWAHKRDHDCVCKVCNKTFHKKGSVDMHMRLKHSEKNIPCPECDRKFPFEFLKNKHISKVHNSAQPMPYKCDKCNFGAVTEVALKIHQRRIHCVQFPEYSCKECKRKFSCKQSYESHVANHSKSNFSCQLCCQKFTCEGDFQAHTESIHEISSNTGVEKSATCNFVNSCMLQYSCAICSVVLNSHDTLAQHMHQYHGMDLDFPQDIKVEIEPIELPEMDKSTESMMQTVNNESSCQEHDRPVKSEPVIFNLPTGLDCVDGRSAILMPASVVPPNVNMVDINGVQYLVIRGNQ